jgi:hypothetical protein
MSTATTTDLGTLKLYELAEMIAADWKPVNFAAKPYLDAMRSLSDMDSQYGYDNGSTVVLYFLSNAAQWRGDTAKAVKAELKKRLKRR